MTGLLGQAKNFLNDTFTASSPPPSIKDLKTDHTTNVTVTQNGSKGTTTKTAGTMNPYTVWIQGNDNIGTVGIDAVLRNSFQIPVSADWKPVLPQFAQDIGGAITGPLKGITGSLSNATSGSIVGVATGAVAAAASGLNAMVAQGGIAAINQASGDLTGETLNNPSWYQLVWQNSSPMAFTLDLDFFTLEDQEKDVLDPVIQLQKFILPEFKNGSMRAPGYHPINGWAGIGSAVTSLGKQGVNHLGTDYKLDIHIGNTCILNNVVLTNINATYEVLPSIQNKKFNRVTCAVSFSTQQVLVKDSIDYIYKKKYPYSYADNDPITSTEQQFSDLKKRASGELSGAIKGAENAARGLIHRGENLATNAFHSAEHAVSNEFHSLVNSAESGLSNIGHRLNPFNW